jgi:hypothetical protein
MEELPLRPEVLESFDHLIQFVSRRLDDRPSCLLQQLGHCLIYLQPNR